MVMAVNVLYVDGVHELYRCRISSFVFFFVAWLNCSDWALACKPLCDKLWSKCYIKAIFKTPRLFCVSVGFIGIFHLVDTFDILDQIFNDLLSYFSQAPWYFIKRKMRFITAELSWKQGTDSSKSLKNKKTSSMLQSVVFTYEKQMTR